MGKRNATSIDARVDAVRLNDDGSGQLLLVNRPARPGGASGTSTGIAGQWCLSFDEAPARVLALQGLDLWGGASTLMLGERKIATRGGYTRITFVDEDLFTEALAVSGVL